jgi:hypothetical protein
MATFDQRNQKVIYQFNAAGNINFGSVKTGPDLAIQLQNLLDEVQQAAKAGVLEAEKSTEVEYRLKKAAQEARKPAPQGRSILENLNEAKAFLEGVAAAAGMVTALAAAAEVVRQLFQL